MITKMHARQIILFVSFELLTIAISGIVWALLGLNPYLGMIIGGGIYVNLAVVTLVALQRK